MSLVFLMGAGASYGSGACTPHPPPLGGQFFKEFQKMGRIAATVSDELKKAFSENFEKGMDKFYEERSADVPEFLRDMAEYFCEFEPSDGNLYGELIELLGYHRKKTTFVTTNYDLLIELSAIQRDMKISYHDLPSNHELSVLKIHGSCHFLPDFRGQENMFHNIKIDVGETRAPAVKTPYVSAILDKAELLRLLRERDDDLMRPGLAAYSPKKEVHYCYDFIIDQQKLWRKAAAQAKSIYIIGLKVHEIDGHIWDVLAKSEAKKFYVGFEPDEFRAWAQRTGAKNCFELAKKFEDALPMIATHLNKKWKKKVWARCLATHPQGQKSHV